MPKKVNLEEEIILALYKFQPIAPCLLVCHDAVEQKARGNWLLLGSQKSGVCSIVYLSFKAMTNMTYFFQSGSTHILSTTSQKCQQQDVNPSMLETWWVKGALSLKQKDY